MTEKLLRCPTCQEHKEPNGFYRDCTRATGFAVTCKSCHTQASKRRRAVLAARSEEELIRDTPEFKRCSGKCKQTKPASEFARSRGVKSGLKGICRSCAAQVWREWSAKNKLKNKQGK